MPEDKSTPEEKLLRLIENPAQAKEAAVKQAKPAAKKVKFKFSFNPAALRQKIKTVIFNFRFLNRFMIGLAAVLFMYLIFDFIKGRPNLNKLSASAVVPAGAGVSRPKGALDIKVVELPEFLSQLEARDIFHLIPLKKEEKLPEAKEVLSSLLTDLKLVGIIWSAKPQAMIEDKKENKTLLLNAGDSIGKIKIKEILRDKVILKYEDQEMELL